MLAKIERDATTAMREYAPIRAVIMDPTLQDGLTGDVLFARLRTLVASSYTHSPMLADHRHHGFTCARKKPFRLDDPRAALRWVLPDAAALTR